MASYLEIYQTLSYNVWKTPTEILKEIAKQKGKNPIVYSASHGDAAMLYLDKLVEEGNANRREIQLTKEQLRIRKGNKAYKYSLTDQGLKRRVELEEDIERLEGILIPSKA